MPNTKAAEADQVEMFNVVAMPLKKEFITIWGMTGVVADNTPSWRRNFFGEWNMGGRPIVYPEDIRMNELLPFHGRKTKITIEVIE